MTIPQDLPRGYDTPRSPRLVRRAAVCALAGFFAVLMTLVAIFLRVAESEAWIDRAHGVRLAIEETLSALATAEAAQKHYLLTRDREMLGLYATARDEALRGAARLETLVEAPLGQRRDATRLRALIERRIGYMEPINQMAQDGDDGLALDRMRDGDGSRLGLQARHLAAGLQQDAGAALKARRAAVATLRWWFLGTAAGLGLGLAAVWTVMFRQAHRAAQHERRLREDLAALVDERTTLMRETNHRVGNSLMMVSSLIELQARRLSDPVQREMFEYARSRIAAVGQAHRRLQEAALLKSLDVAPYLEALCDDLGRSVTGDGRRIDVEADPLVLPAKTAVSLGLIVNELVMSAIRHDSGPAGSGRVAVQFRRAGSALRLSVHDGGGSVRPQPGQTEPGQAEPGGADPQGLGLPILRALVNQIGGELSVRYQNGTETSVTFPTPA